MAALQPRRVQIYHLKWKNVGPPYAWIISYIPIYLLYSYITYIYRYTFIHIHIRALHTYKASQYPSTFNIIITYITIWFVWDRSKNLLRARYLRVSTNEYYILYYTGCFVEHANTLFYLDNNVITENVLIFGVFKLFWNT